MPVEWVEADVGGHWLISGRVIDRPFPSTVRIAEGSHRLQVNGDITQTLEPGELVRVHATVDMHPTELVVPADKSFPVYVAFDVERVHTPRRAPWLAGGETHRMDRESMRDRLTLRMNVRDRVAAYFRTQGFLEVDTPAVVTSPGLDVHLQGFEVLSTPDDTGHAPHAGYLITSPEYHMKRLLVGGVARCYQFARCFRAAELGRRHQPEFTMLEWYRAWATLDDVLSDTEAVVRAAAAAGTTPGVLHVKGRPVNVAEPFARITVREAFARWAPEVRDCVALAHDDEERYFELLSDRVEPRLGLDAPVFLTRFPSVHASLARRCDDDPTVCERAELYVRGVELSNGFGELTDPDEQRARLERDQIARKVRGLPVYPIDRMFLAALDEGMPPSAGNALGFDRLLTLVAGVDDIADVMAFPHAGR